MPEESSGNNSSLNGYDPLSDFPGQNLPPKEQGDPQVLNKFELFWRRVANAGMIEPVLRVGTVLFSIILALLVVWAMRTYLADFPVQEIARGESAVLAAALPTATPTPKNPGLPDLPFSGSNLIGITRLASLHTSIPTRSRVDVITYTVALGDSVFGIAEMFNLKPETILWANSATLQDNPHRLQVGQEINIMPTNGTFHKWREGEDLGKVAEFYQVEPSVILEWPGNHFDLLANNLTNPEIEPGTMLIVPGGQREMIDYGPPRIPRDNPAIARTYGPGHCGVLTDGIVGDGLFIWPTATRWLSGYDFSPETNHSGIDIGGNIGDAIWNIDDGVVVYAGWSYSGYGNLIVIDHGNDWQSLYAHLDAVYVSCGQSVYQGANIGSMGNTGNSSGPHLHFEMLYGSAKVDPRNFIP
jgi:murein DD-endopeptidase MepM/ murein hydrolase activator NlpD